QQRQLRVLLHYNPGRYNLSRVDPKIVNLKCFPTPKQQPHYFYHSQEKFTVSIKHLSGLSNTQLSTPIEKYN
ncbi:hypothetical protein LINGRAHAP2_LOCUS13945, partial [Linum grandiflorum]